jgi:hypothetical protein
MDSVASSSLLLLQQDSLFFDCTLGPVNRIEELSAPMMMTVFVYVSVPVSVYVAILVFIRLYLSFSLWQWSRSRKYCGLFRV